jgi:hypothetical protein
MRAYLKLLPALVLPIALFAQPRAAQQAAPIEPPGTFSILLATA